MSEDYVTLNGYQVEADLGLGCGLPTQFARIQPGDVVVDLGSGAGNDCLVARHETGDSGLVIGIDFTPNMIEKARINAQANGFTNVEFREGDIEEMPVDSNSVDVVISNCVLNLIPNKQKVFQEIFRILKPGGHFCISDVVLTKTLPRGLLAQAEMYAGCVSGAIQKSVYMDIISNTGFVSIKVKKDRSIDIPDDILQHYLSPTDSKEIGIQSITVFATKPSVDACV